MHPVALSAVAVHDTFWSPKLRVLREVTVNDVFDKFERDGAFSNFDRVAQGLTGGHCGSPWFDGLIFETMRAVSDFLAAEYSAVLDMRMDGYIERVTAAQDANQDGYLNTYISLMHPEQRWGALGGNQLWSHEEYNAGCLVEAGVHHYRATGKINLLMVAVRFASYMAITIGPAPKMNVVPSHSLPEEAFIKLYRLMRDEPSLAEKVGLIGDPRQFLDLVRFWLDNRGNHNGRINFTEYAQDHCCLQEQNEAVGHSVRGTLLYTGLATMAAETGEEKDFSASRRLWEDVVERKMFITGGVGPIKEYEGFGYGYYLPNTGYIETCAGVGLAFWASQMNQAFGAADYMDVYERVAYNNVLAGVSLDGSRYSYENPLLSRGTMHRWDWHRCPCCPPMLLKLFAEMPGLIYTSDGDDLYVNLYIGSRATVDLPSSSVRLFMEGRYPWEGQVRLTVETAAPGAIGLRVPVWCHSFQARVNGEEQDGSLVDGYFILRRAWQPGDVVTLDLAMPVERVASHPFVGGSRDRVAIQRGPVVYCLEGVDNPLGAEPELPFQVDLVTEFRPDLLGGVVVVRGRDAEGKPLTAIPYFAWDNRPVEREEQDWLMVWIKQQDWFHARQPLDGNNREAWAHALYLPIPQEEEQR
jgi:DUF1680 family protein